jgi:hypothetical protein
MKKPLRLPGNELEEQVEIKLKNIVDYLIQIENKDENPPALFSGNMGIFRMMRVVKPCGRNIKSNRGGDSMCLHCGSKEHYRKSLISIGVILDNH